VLCGRVVDRQTTQLGQNLPSDEVLLAIGEGDLGAQTSLTQYSTTLSTSPPEPADPTEYPSPPCEAQLDHELLQRLLLAAEVVDIGVGEVVGLTEICLMLLPMSFWLSAYS
jgi:hypothetical protein